MKILKSPQALLDIIALAEHIALDSIGASKRFIYAAEATFQQLSQHPELGTEGEFASPSLVGVRRWRIRGFSKYLIFYRVRTDAIEVLRIIHGARDFDALFGEADPGEGQPQIE